MLDDHFREPEDKGFRIALILALSYKAESIVVEILSDRSTESSRDASSTITSSQSWNVWW